MTVYDCRGRDKAFKCHICKDPVHPVQCEDCPDCNINLGMALDYR